MFAARHISSRQDLLEFIEMWSLLKNISLMNEVKDSLIWKWTPSGKYTAASAYKIQFHSSHAPFQVGQLWKAKAEPKIKLFGWTAMHHKILIADCLAARGMQHNQFCPLCNTHPEDGQHLLTNFLIHQL
jgi:hypothetical protein